MKKAVIIHQYLPENALPDELDVIDQANAIKESLSELGYNSQLLSVSLNLEKMVDNLTRIQPEVVVNLVETLGGHGRLIHLVPALLESLNIPFTGCGQHALNITTGKVVAKEEMATAGVPTPEFFSSDEIAYMLPGNKYILKPEWEDASVGITDEKVVTSENATGAFNKALKSGIKDWFFEEYIDGREFNVTMLETREGWKIFSPVEILFLNFPKGKPKILGYESKWQGQSFEYNNTPRTFDINVEDRALINSMREISEKCIQVFKLKGYARVDFRVDLNHNPYVLEVNANPCLSPDAGFFAACSHEGMEYTKMISHIIESAYK